MNLNFGETFHFEVPVGTLVDEKVIEF